MTGRLIYDPTSKLEPEVVRVGVYCDESSQNNRFMVLGSLWVALDRMDEILDDIGHVRSTNRCHGTMKWGNVSNAYLSAYKAMVSLFAKYAAEDVMHYNCMILDTAEFDHKRYHGGDDELAYYKFFYQLLFHRMRYKNALYYVVMDRRSNRKNHRLTDLREVLNAASRRYVDRLVDPVRSIISRSTPEEPLLQLNDILTGAVAYQANDRDRRPDASPARVQLAEHLCRVLGRQRLWQTATREMRFNIWRFALRPRAPKTARSPNA